MEEDIKILENMLNTTKTNRRGNREIRFEINSNYYKSIENLIKEYRELEKFRDITLMKSNTKFANVIKDSIYFDYIPKQKVKEVIEKAIKDYEEEKNYRYTPEVEDEQLVLKYIMKEILGDKE